MGYVGVEHAKAGTPINILIRNKEIPATVAAIPFITKK
jgi:glycine cleavage system aminomethyltransferase T